MNTEEFKRVLGKRLDEGARAGRPSVELTSGDLHREVGGYPGTGHRMPLLCNVMRASMKAGDVIVAQPPKGTGATLTIRYRLPRH
jgi:hypothetical protein